MIKRLILLGFINILALAVYAQTETSIITGHKPMGRNHITQKEIIANEIVFPEKIYHAYIDTLTDLATVQLRGTIRKGKYLDSSGKVIVFDLANNKVKWSKPMNYFSGNIEQHNNLLIQNDGIRSYCLNPQTGEEQWDVRYTVYYSVPLYKIGLGYKYKIYNEHNNMLEGIDLQNGKSLWKREINRDYGWNDLIHLNDSVVIIAASGLHAVNVKNGTGWDYDTETGFSNSGGIVTGIVSNLLVDSAHLYLTSKEKISRLNHQGQILWSTALPYDLTSQSQIFIKDSVLYLVNYGYVLRGNTHLGTGRAFIAAYCLKTGVQLFVNTTRNREDEINAFTVRKDTLLLVFKDRVSKYSLHDATLILEKEFDPYDVGELQYPIGNHTFMKSDSIYKSLTLTDTTKYYVQTSKEKILVLNDHLEVTNQLDSKELYTFYRKEKEYKFLTKGNKTTVIDRNNKEIATIDISGITRKIGDKLYNIQEKSLIELYMDDLINDDTP